VRGALIRYRTIAYIVGIVLILLVVIGMPLKYIWDQPVVVQSIGPAHGFLYMIYLVAAFDLGRRAGWKPERMLMVMLAGTIPFLSFYAERVVVTRWIPATRAAGDHPPAPVEKQPLR
jgi:integral membrane protein